MSFHGNLTSDGSKMNELLWTVS